MALVGDYVWTICLVMLLAGGLAYCSTLASAQSSRQFSSLGVGETFVGVVTIADADTIKIGGQRIRLWGIDAPEIDQACTGRSAGILAAHALVLVADSRQVQCEVRMRPNQNRAVASCSVGTTDLAGAMVDRGWAWEDMRFSDGRYTHREERARAQRLGIWAMQCEEPWAYRARQSR